MEGEMKNYSIRFRFQDGRSIQYNFKAKSNDDAYSIADDRHKLVMSNLERGIQFRSIELFREGKNIPYDSE